MARKTAITAPHIIAYDGEGHRHLQDGGIVYGRAYGILRVTSELFSLSSPSPP